jgi:hypothetical protein
MDYKPYLDLITPQHRVRPKYMRWAAFLLSLFDIDMGRRVAGMFDPHTAEGKTLDIVGELVGIGRKFPALSPIPGYEHDMTDDIYRKMILAKIVTNNYSGMQGDLPNLWESVFGRDLIAVNHDNQDMLMDIDLIGDFGPVDTQLVLDGYIVPKPVGVGMKVALATEIDAPRLGEASTASNDASIELLLDNAVTQTPRAELNAASAPPSSAASIEIFYRGDVSTVPTVALLFGVIPSSNDAVVEMFMPVPDLLYSSAAREGIASAFGAVSAMIEILTADAMPSAP